MNVRYLVLAGAVALAVSSHAYAGTVYDVNFVGTDGAGAVTANLVLDVVNNTVVSGTWHHHPECLGHGFHDLPVLAHPRHDV